MASQFCIFAWRNPRTEEPDRLWLYIFLAGIHMLTSPNFSITVNFSVSFPFLPCHIFLKEFCNLSPHFNSLIEHLKQFQCKMFVITLLNNFTFIYV